MLFRTSMLVLLLLFVSSTQAYQINYHFHEDNDQEVNECIASAIGQLMQDTCVEFKHNPQAQNAIVFMQSRRCGWQEENSTVHLNSECLEPENCTQFVQHALSSPEKQHPSTAIRHLNLKFNCTDKCTILCENGGVPNPDCTCKCSYGFYGKHCEQLKLNNLFTDPSCGLIEASNSGVISLRNQVESNTFCQWVLKASDPWKTFALEFEDLDLDDGNAPMDQKCGDLLYIYGVKGNQLVNPVPCNDNDHSLVGESLHSESNLLFIEYRGNRLPSRQHKGPTLKYRVIGSPIPNEIRTFHSQQVSSAFDLAPSYWWPIVALLPALLI